jgi:SAM-dependent methyltransferase
MSDTLGQSRQFWDSHAQSDPLWAILSDPVRKGRRWDLDRFFQSGVDEVFLILHQLRSRDIGVPRRRALDFGCGVGRLSQALTAHFARIDGVDLSFAMIDLARSLNNQGERIVYHVNERPDLHLFPDGTFDFIVSSIVLQHMEPSIALGYLAEMCRVLAAAGALVFQVPARRREGSDPQGTTEPQVSNPPAEAYRASLSVTGIPETAVPPDAELQLHVDVVNASRFVWSPPRFGVIRVGNHWFDSSGYAMLIADDGRASLPQPLGPGDRCTTQLTMTTPRECGDYWCEVDLAHEGVVWFRERGSTAVRFVVRVRPEAEASVETPLAGQPEAIESLAVRVSAEPDQIPSLELSTAMPSDVKDFPMFGIPQEEVLKLLASCSMKVIAVDDDHSCGDDWISYRYYAIKPGKILQPDPQERSRLLD